MKKIGVLIVFFSSLYVLPITHAVVTVPIADLVGQPLQNIYPDQSIDQAYAQLPLCGGTIKNDLNCLRIHQLLFNEMVEIIAEKNDEIMVRIPHLFYLTPNDTQRHDTYWMLKKAVTPLPLLNQHNIPLNTFPINYSYAYPAQLSNQNLIVLVEPWYDKITRMTFSAGTQFVAAAHSMNHDHVCIKRYNPLLRINQIVPIPKKLTFTSSYPQKPQQCIDLFLSILHRWIQTNEGDVSYVLGGCSFTHRSNRPFAHKTNIYNNKHLSFYTRRYDTSPKNGYDCSGLIAKSAQLAGIPYFFKNTFTVAQCLTEIRSNTSLHDGDIIWIPGHVMVVSNIKKNLLIEARSYQHGYGIVHEIALNKVFKNINTYQDLLDCYFNKKELTRLDRHNNPQDTFKQMKILSLASCWTLDIKKDAL